MLTFPRTTFGLPRGPGHKGPLTSGLLWFVCWLFTGDVCGCVAVLVVGCVGYVDVAT